LPVMIQQLSSTSHYQLYIWDLLFDCLERLEKHIQPLVAVEGIKNAQEEYVPFVLLLQGIKELGVHSHRHELDLIHKGLQAVRDMPGPGHQNPGRSLE